MRQLTYSVLPALLLILPLVALGAEASSDASFYKQAAQGGLAEVEAGRLAEQKSSDSKVKEFAAHMVKDHSAANEELKAVAAKQNVTLPDSPSVKQKATKAKLEALSGQTFDKAYIKDQVQAHKDTVALLHKEIASGQDSEAKAFARKVLPTVQSHLREIDEIAHAAGIEKSTASR